MTQECLSPQMRVLEWSGWWFPAGHPLQGTEVIPLATPQASLERLFPLEDFLAAWKLLPNVSKWVLQTVERGYRIQFGSRQPCFNRVIPTLVGPEHALVMEHEVDTLLRKGAIERVPPLSRESPGSTAVT